MTDDRYRNVAEARLVDAFALMGWHHASDRDAAKRAASAALRRWIARGLAFRPAPDGARLFDPVEANNFMRRAAREGDDFFSHRYVPTLRRLVSDASDASEGPARRYTIDFTRTFDLRSHDVGTRVRLRAPLPRVGRTLYDLDVRPRAPNDANVRLEASAGRLELRGPVPAARTLTLGATVSFTSEIQRPGGRSLDPPGDLEPYLRDREGLVVVTPRVRDVAASLAAPGTPALETTRRIWEYLCGALTIGSLRYDSIDPAAPCDVALASGWADCRLAASVLVAACRARRIPARVLGGYLLYPGASTAHYWAEVWIDGGGWMPIDFLGWDLGDGGRDEAWRDRFFGTLDDRSTTERLPFEFTGAIGVPMPSAWSLLQTADAAGTHVALLDNGGTAVYVDTLRVGSPAIPT